MTERDLHDQFTAWLEKHRIPYGHDRMDRETSTVVGEPDFRCYWKGKVCFVEFKLVGKKLSAAQVERGKTLAAAGCKVHLCFDAESAIGIVSQELLEGPAGEAETPSPAKPEPKMWVAWSSSLQMNVVVARDQKGTVCAIRVAGPSDLENLPSRASFLG